MKATTRALATLALVLATFVLYAPTQEGEFVSYDDPRYVTENPHLEGGLEPENLRWALTSLRGGNWHPLTWVSHMGDVELYGLDDPGGHHRTSAILHALTSGLLVLALAALTGAFWPSFFAALLFAVHPLRVESVAWISERKDVMCGLFWVLTCLAYAGYVRRRSMGRYLLVLAAFACCMASKSMGVTLPFVLLLFDRWPLGRTAETSWRRLVLEKVPLLLVSVAVSVATVFAQGSSGSIGSIERLTMPERVANAVQTYAAYLGRTIWPKGLACFYPHPGLVDPAFSPYGLEVLGALTALVGVTGLAILWRLVRPWLLTSWLLYLGVLVPTIGLLQVGAQASADRYTYLPSVGITLAVVWSVHSWCRGRRRRIVMAAALGLFVALLGARLTRYQIRTWRTSETLYVHAIASTGRNYTAANNLGILREANGELGHAESLYRLALEYRPGHPDAATNLGKLLLERGDLAGARPLLEQAVESNPDSVVALSNLGVLHLSEGRTGPARGAFERAIALDPENAIAHRNLGLLFASASNPGAALGHHQRVVELEPEDADARHSLASTLMGLRRYEEAERELLALVELEPGGSRGPRALAQLTLDQGRRSEAVTYYTAAIAAAPEDLTIREDLAWLHEAADQDAEAVAVYRELLTLRPDDISYMHALAWVLVTTEEEGLRDPDAALELCDRAVVLTNEEDAATYAIMASAWAAKGKLKRAERWQRKAVDVAPPALIHDMRARLEAIVAAQQGRGLSSNDLLRRNR